MGARSKQRAHLLTERLVGVILSLTSLVVVITCTAKARQPAYPAPPMSSPAQTAQPSSAEGSTPGVQAPANSTGGDSGGSVASLESSLLLSRFFAGLRELEQGTRQEHVRIAWLGDSHTAADLWTHVVRRALQDRFGVGGPGFFHVGLKKSRHTQLKVDVLGKWRRVPVQPARTAPFADGIFGLGGIRAAAEHKAACTVELRRGAVSGNARWSLFYRLAAGASFSIKLGDHQETLRSQVKPSGEIASISIESAPEHVLEIRQSTGMPEFFGASVESSQPGVVLDTLGIDGARARTPLAWDATAWERELARRPFELVVLAYGTNEVFENVDVSTYAERYRELLARIRMVHPKVDCLMIGPTDVATGDGSSHPRVLEISEVQAQSAQTLGCLYWGAHELMGGEGSFAAWQAHSPQLAGADGVHLTVRGYQELGALMSERMLSLYEHWLSQQR